MARHRKQVPLNRSDLRASAYGPQGYQNWGLSVGESTPTEETQFREALFGLRVEAGECYDNNRLLGESCRDRTLTHRLRGLSET